MNHVTRGMGQNRGLATRAVGPLRVRALVSTTRRRVIVLAAFAFLAAAIAMHHLPMIDMHAASVGVCLAILYVAAGAAITAAIRPSGCGRRVRVLPRRSVAVPEPITVPARAGPRHLEILRL